MAPLVMIMGHETGVKTRPYTTKNKQPTELMKRSLATSFIKNDVKTVAIAA